MVDTPSGNVTFLFTDIEGSTMLAQEFPDSLPISLRKHHSIMEEAIESNNGFVFKTIGDAFCATFTNAHDAVKAACDAQLKINSEKWNGAVIKVRMGIHSGNAEWNGSVYMGYITLARAHRVMGAASGGQILISNDASEAAKEKVHGKISFRDFGERRLKDLIQPMRLYQIISPELPSDFPPLKTLDASPNNLPVQLTSFIGRDEEMRKIKELLKQTHLLTLTGSGGSGKTRIALQVAAEIIDDYANGVWFVDLASLIDPALLPEAIAQALGVQEQPKQTLEITLCNYLKDKVILFILDNCEHLIESCAVLTEKLLSISAGLKIIATSREALRCSGEQTHSVSSLEIPDPKEKISLETLTQFESVRLFIERALAVDPKFRVNDKNASALTGICNQLDGIPLAIELAAARINILSIPKIHERLNNRFKLLTGGKRTALPRQQTLKALIDWSYDLLSEREKILWGRLSVFTGGWSLEAAEVICSDEDISNEDVLGILNQLTEKSIIIFNEKNERYRMLETIKQYGEEKLKETSESENISRNHLKFYMELAELAEEKLYESQMHKWLEKLDSENGNFEKALLCSLESEDRAEGMKLAGSLGYFWKVRGNFSAGRRWLAAVLNNHTLAATPERGKVLNFAGDLALLQGEFDKGRELIEESLSINEEIVDKTGIAFSLNNLGNVSFLQGEYGKAKEFFEKSLATSRELGNRYHIASSINNLGNVAFYQSDYLKAHELYVQSLTLRRETGDQRGIAVSLNNLGNVAFNQGEYESSSKLQEECLAICRRIGNKPGIGSSLNNLGTVVSNQGDYDRARRLHEESIDLYREIGDKSGITWSLNNLGLVALQQGEHDRAQELYEESLAISREIGNKYFMASSLNSLGNVALHKDNQTLARKFYQESLTLNQELGHRKDIVSNILGLAGIQTFNSFYEQAARLLGLIEEVLKSMSGVLEKHEVLFHERILSILRENLNEKEFIKHFNEGKEMTLEQAIEISLRKYDDE